MSIKPYNQSLHDEMLGKGYTFKETTKTQHYVDGEGWSKVKMQEEILSRREVRQ